MLSNLFSIPQSFCLPSVCLLCNQFHREKLAVCSFCIGLLTELNSCCQLCAEPLADDKYPICGTCIKKPPHFDRAFIPYIFKEPLRGLLHKFKYHKGLYIAPLLAHLMCQSLPKMLHKPQCLIPVPIHKQKLKQRGFNQAVVLAKLISKKTNIPYNLHSCSKITNTVAQANLDRAQRQANIHKTFSTKPILYQHVALIDDLLTTGSTANELAFTLKKSGVQQVDIWCCARKIL